MFLLSSCKSMHVLPSIWWYQNMLASCLNKHYSSHFSFVKLEMEIRQNCKFYGYIFTCMHRITTEREVISRDVWSACTDRVKKARLPSYSTKDNVRTGHAVAVQTQSNLQSTYICQIFHQWYYAIRWTHWWSTDHMFWDWQLFYSKFCWDFLKQGLVIEIILYILKSLSGGFTC